VPAYPGLRRFNNFSTVKQWTGVEQRAVSRQFILVIAQEYEENGRSAGASTLNGKRVGQLLLIVSVRDHERQVNSKKKKKEGKRSAVT
jgi:hypothetical protein